MKARRGLDALLGLGYVAVAGLLVAVSILVYNKAFTDTAQVTLQASSIGNALQDGSDVKYHGVPVGEVRDIEPTPDGAELTLALKPSVVEELPANTVARLLPKTLFGERYVDLVLPDQPTPVPLQSGDTIHEDDSAEAVELQQVFDQLLPVLQAIQPQKLAATLGELSAMLRGRGDDIGAAMADWAAYLRKLNPKVPQITEDLARLADVARDYDDAVPVLLHALDTMTTTSATLVDRQGSLRQVFANVIIAADTTNGWVTENQHTIEVLSAESRKALQVVAPYAVEFPCLFASARSFVPVMDRTLGKGTDEPGMHIKLSITESRGKYLPGVDDPVFLAGKQPRCPYVTGQTGTRPVSARLAARSNSTTLATPATISPPPSQLLRGQVESAAGLGPANSPGENQLIAELVAPTQRIAPSAYPKWNSLLLGPVLRDRKVVLR